MNKITFRNLAGSSLSLYPGVKAFLLLLLLCGAGHKGFATAWTTSTAGPITTLTNWTDGSVSPSTFATPGDTWTVTLAMTIASSAVWTVGTPSSAPASVTFATGGTMAMSGAGGTSTIKLYGDLVMTGGTITVGGAGTTMDFHVIGNITVNSGSMTCTGSGTDLNLNGAGLFTVTGGTIMPSGAGAVMTIINTGNFNMTGGAITADADIFMTINGNSTISGGVLSTAGASGLLTINNHGNFTMTGGAFNSTGASSDVLLNIYGNCSYSGPCSMTSSGAGTTSEVHLMWPTASGTMMIDNTSTGAWSGTNIYVDAGCTAQLAGNFSTTTGAAAFGLTVNGTLICPAAYMVNGTRKFALNPLATLVVAIPTGINGAIITTGTTTFSNNANYTFNGTAAQVTGTYLPVSLIAPSLLTISNSAGVTLSQTTVTTGTLAFTAGILNTGAFTMTTPGAAGNVTGAGATSYVNGTLIKTITGLTSVNYEVGDVNYAPMLLTFSGAGTAGSLGLMATNGLHPSVGTSGLSTSNMANHYWTITNYAAAGPVTVVPKATYNAVDIIGGSNAAFVTQQYAAAAWLPASLATTNTSSPFTSAPSAGIALAALPGQYIFGNLPCGTAPITGTPTLCVGATTSLADATPGGTWDSGTPGVATVSTSGLVTGISAGTSIISYTAGGCTVTMVVTVSAMPDAGTIAGVTSACIGFTTPLTNTATGGTWSSSTTSVATVSATGVVSGITAGTSTIIYTVTNSCGTATTSVVVTVASTLTVGPITGVDSVCAGQTIVLSNATGGGVWSSTNLTIATVSATGVVTGIAPGYDTIVYTITNSCGTADTFLRIKVRPDTACPSSVINLPAAQAVTELLVFPNPNSGAFTINLTSAGNEAVHVVISDMVGRKIKELATASNISTAVLLNQPPGIYFVSATIGNERYFVKVLVE